MPDSSPEKRSRKVLHAETVPLNSRQMRKPTRVRSTDKIELVETQNIALSLRRCGEIPNAYNDSPARRALYHAVCMVGVFSPEERKALREALKLP